MRRAQTLLELTVALTILVALSGLVVPLFSSVLQDSHETATKASLVEIRNAVSNYWSDTKHITLDGVITVGTEANRFQVAWLYRNPVTGDTTFDFDPVSRIGWRGPYLQTATADIAAFGYPSLIDAWNQEIQIQDVDSSSVPRDVRIVSAGPDGTIDIPAATATSALTPADLGDDFYVALTLR